MQYLSGYLLFSAKIWYSILKKSIVHNLRKEECCSFDLKMIIGYIKLVYLVVDKLSNMTTVLWQWKRQWEYESEKHCCDSINNSKLDENSYQVILQFHLIQMSKLCGVMV